MYVYIIVQLEFVIEWLDFRAGMLYVCISKEKYGSTRSYQERACA